jgi:hypothetical protein
VSALAHPMRRGCGHRHVPVHGCSAQCNPCTPQAGPRRGISTGRSCSSRSAGRIPCGGARAVGGPSARQFASLLHHHTRAIRFHDRRWSTCGSGLVERNGTGACAARLRDILEVPESLRQMLEAQIIADDSERACWRSPRSQEYRSRRIARRRRSDVGMFEACCDELARRNHICGSRALRSCPTDRSSNATSSCTRSTGRRSTSGRRRARKHSRRAERRGGLAGAPTRWRPRSPIPRRAPTGLAR